MAVETWLLLAAAVVLAWAYSRWRHSYWVARGVASPPTLPFLGHIHCNFGRRWLTVHEIYKKYRHSKVWGTYEFLTPILMVSNPDLLKHIMVKDFEHFVDRRMIGDQKGSLMREMLSNKVGEEWKNLRSIMSPAFSSGKMRGMYPLICDKAHNLVSYSLKKAAHNTSVDMIDNFGRFTMDTIASCAFGIECNSLSDHSKPLFVQKAENFFNFQGLRALRIILMITSPKVFNLLGLKADLPELDFFASTVRETIKAREKGVKRGDFLDVLLEAEDTGDSTSPSHRVFQGNTLFAQSVLFLIAGYDNTASTLAFSSFLLAKHRQYQQRLRHELQGLLEEHGAITYEGIMEAKFLDACLMETLRLYPSGFIGERMCTKQYRIPGTEIVIEPGQIVNFPFWSLHHDPHYWPNAEEFQPDRFMPENRGNIKSFTHMPFGMGPRNCIAMRFALMEVKVALAHLLLAADLKLAPGHEELRLQNSPFFLKPEKGMQLLLIPFKKE